MDLMALEKISLNGNVEYGALKKYRIICSMALEKIPDSKKKFELLFQWPSKSFHKKIHGQGYDGPRKKIKNPQHRF